MTDALKPDPQNEELPATELSVEQELVSSGVEKLLDVRGYLQTRKLVLNNPELSLAVAPLPDRPLAFALKGALVPTLIISLVTWLLTTCANMPSSTSTERDEEYWRIYRDSLNGYIAALGTVQKAQPVPVPEIGRELRRVRAERRAVVDSLDSHSFDSDIESTLADYQGLLLSILFVVPAIFFRRSLRKYATTAPKVRRADRAYLYYVSARVLMPGLVIVLIGFLVDVLGRYDYGDETDLTVFGLITMSAIIWQFVAYLKSAEPLADILGLGAAELGGRSPARVVRWALVKSYLQATLATGAAVVLLLLVVAD